MVISVEIVQERLKVEDDIYLPSGATVSVSFFANVLFKDITEFTYQGFIDAGAEVKGYKDYFDQCLEQGLIN